VNDRQGPSLYDVLGVPGTASTDDIRAVYRARIKAYHPDRNPSTDAKEAAALLNEAWHVLRDPDRRRAYDAHLSASATRETREPTPDQPTAEGPTGPESAETRETAECTPWSCPACRRSVPRYVDECRCGQVRPSPSAGSVEPPSEVPVMSSWLWRQPPWPRSPESLGNAARFGLLAVVLVYNVLPADDGAATNARPQVARQEAPTVAPVPQMPTGPSEPAAIGQSPEQDDFALLREEEQAAWEERQRLGRAVLAARERRTTPGSLPTSAPPPRPQYVPTPLERMQEQARASFAPTLAVLRRRADGLLGNFRRYLDGCYRKATTATTAGASVGWGSASSVGAAIDQDGFIAWDVAARFAWQETWAAEQRIDNETTALCRTLWSDIAAETRIIHDELAAIDEAARRAGIYPGVVRDLRAEYGFPR